jgi:hypothetical protein
VQNKSKITSQKIKIVNLKILILSILIYAESAEGNSKVAFELASAKVKRIFRNNCNSGNS